MLALLYQRLAVGQHLFGSGDAFVDAKFTKQMESAQEYADGARAGYLPTDVTPSGATYSGRQAWTDARHQVEPELAVLRGTAE